MNIKPWHIHGNVTLGDGAELRVTITCDAETEEAAQHLAWRACDIDVQEIECATCNSPDADCECWWDGEEWQPQRPAGHPLACVGGN